MLRSYVGSSDPMSSMQLQQGCALHVCLGGPVRSGRSSWAMSSLRRTDSLIKFLSDQSNHISMCTLSARCMIKRALGLGVSQCSAKWTDVRPIATSLLNDWKASFHEGSASRYPTPHIHSLIPRSVLRTRCTYPTKTRTLQSFTFTNLSRHFLHNLSSHCVQIDAKSDLHYIRFPECDLHMPRRTSCMMVLLVPSGGHKGINTPLTTECPPIARRCRRKL
jgi:hypothetical protein